jgi:cysteinyl-tRNA synthetase
VDFVLWKPSSDDLPGWDSPWGRGRPGWHIECSAMSKALLGEVFDIHGGGNDLMFPHHENEIAQSCCANHTDRMAQIWMHNEMLQVEGKKMSKSLGNFFTVRDLLDQGVPGEVIRFVFLSTHYSKPMDWTQRKAEEAEKTLELWQRLTMVMKPTLEHEFQPDSKLLEALSDDLNTHLALVYLRALQGQPQKLLDHARWLGFLSDASRAEFSARFAAYETGSGTGKTSELASLAASLDLERNRAKQTKDFTSVDALKSALTEAGVEVRMSKDGVELIPGPGFDSTKLEGLL